MPTSNERRALWFLAIVALSGTLVRMVRSRTQVAPSTPNADLVRQLDRVDSARARRDASKRSKAKPEPAPTKPSGPLDLDHASAREIEGLPGIGPALATRIVAHRDSAGSFGSAEAFCRVRGIGPALFRRLRNDVTFSGIPVAADSCEAAPPRASKTHVTNREKRR
jgi:competence ComEA-like helix-hairpin-helix protein